MNLAMVYLANQSPPILESKDAYGDGLAHDAVINARRASAALGFRGHLAHVEGGLEISLQDQSLAPVAGWAGRLKLQRADTQAHDADLPLVEASPGQYRAAWSGAPGLYRLDAELTDGQRTWIDSQRLVLR
ncbi:MAG: FixH family protein [bacterium]